MNKIRILKCKWLGRPYRDQLGSRSNENRVFVLFKPEFFFKRNLVAELPHSDLLGHRDQLPEYFAIDL